MSKGCQWTKFRAKLERLRMKVDRVGEFEPERFRETGTYDCGVEIDDSVLLVDKIISRTKRGTVRKSLRVQEFE